MIATYLNEIDDPLVLPYRAGGAFGSGNFSTLPETADHDMGSDKKPIQHYFLHSLFGSKLAS